MNFYFLHETNNVRTQNYGDDQCNKYIVQVEFLYMVTFILFPRLPYLSPFCHRLLICTLLWLPS